MIEQRQYFLLVFLLCTCGVSYAQTHPATPQAKYVTTLTGQTEVATSITTDWETIIFTMPNGGYDYVIHVGDLSFSGNCQDIGGISLQTIINTVANDAIELGIASGYPGCSLTSYTQSVHIWTISCAERSGTLCNTGFAPCGTNWCTRTYSVVCPGNGLDPTIAYVGNTGSSCSQCSGEETCP